MKSVQLLIICIGKKIIFHILPRRQGQLMDGKLCLGITFRSNIKYNLYFMVLATMMEKQAKGKERVYPVHLYNSSFISLKVIIIIIQIIYSTNSDFQIPTDCMEDGKHTSFWFPLWTDWNPSAIIQYGSLIIMIRIIKLIFFLYF